MYSDDTVVVGDVTYTASFNSASADFGSFIIYSVYGSFIMYYCFCCSGPFLDTLGLVEQDGLLQMQQVMY